MQITMDKAPMQAGALCNDIAFQNYAAARNGFAKGEFDTSKSAEHIRQICKIESRRELLKNSAAFARFLILYEDFLVWSGRAQVPYR